jgi:hypothetical protein
MIASPGRAEDRAERHRLGVTALLHLGHQRRAKERRRAHGITSECGKQHAAPDRHVGEPAAQPADPLVDRVHQVDGDARAEHYLAHDHEQRDGHEGEGHQRRGGIGDQLFHPHQPAEEQIGRHDIDQQEGEGDRHAHEHQRE